MTAETPTHLEAEADVAMHAFETARLRMRPLDASDEWLYGTLYTNAELMQFIAAPLTQEAARKSFQVALRQQAPRPQRWIVFPRDGDTAIGLLGLIGIADRPEIGVMLLPHAHGRGIGTEAMRGLADYAFDAFALQWIRARQSVVDNPTVIRMMTRLGYTSLPPTPQHPGGGEWELPRCRWLVTQVPSAMAHPAASG
jgi:[ribosomal protein S5]-alanine N-acetyltransferase